MLASEIFSLRMEQGENAMAKTGKTRKPRKGGSQPAADGNSINTQLPQQTRKQLLKHYRNRYRAGR